MSAHDDVWSRWRSHVEAVEQSRATAYASLWPDGRMGPLDERLPACGAFVLLKGSFDPPHNGHVSLFRQASRKHGRAPGAFLLSLNTAKRRLRPAEIVERSQLIHAAGFPVVVALSGNFSEDVAYCVRRAPALVVVFPVGSDVMARLVAYYAPAEFRTLFASARFDYWLRPGTELPASSGDYANVECLGRNRWPAVSSTLLRNLRDAGDERGVRARMPHRAAEVFLAGLSTPLDRPAARAAPTWTLSRHRPGLAIARCDGAYLFSQDGRAILDASGGAGAVNVGYGRQDVIAAVAAASSATSFCLPGMATAGREDLAVTLHARWLPRFSPRVHLVSTGSDAIDAAAIAARRYQVARGRLGRWKIVGRELSYHGGTLAALAFGSHDDRRRSLGPLLLDQPHAPACYCLRCPLRLTYPGCHVACADALERLIQAEGPETVAAFLVEPIVGASGGAIVPPDEYWAAVAAICRRHHILLIADETMTGFGRTGVGFAWEHWGDAPDIVVAAKGLTGGYAPLAVVAVSDEVASTLERHNALLVAHTFDAHPAACAAALAVLGIIEDERLVDRVRSLGELLGSALTTRLARHPRVAQVRGRGLLWAVEIVRRRETLERFPSQAQITRRIVDDALRRGVLLYPGGTGAERDIIVMSPPFVVQPSDIDTIAATLEEAVNQTTAHAGAG